MPFGISYMFEEIPVDLFLEYVPVFKLLPATGFNWDASAGIRYYPGSR